MSRQLRIRIRVLGLVLCFTAKRKVLFATGDLFDPRDHLRWF